MIKSVLVALALLAACTLSVVPPECVEQVEAEATGDLDCSPCLDWCTGCPSWCDQCSDACDGYTDEDQ